MRFLQAKWRGVLLALVLTSSQLVSATELLNSSYDVSRDVFVDINTLFTKNWDKSHPQDPIHIHQTHAASSRQAMAILQGLRADVVTYNQVPDVQILHDKGHLLAKDWQQRLSNHSSPYYSTMAFLVRKGNPKNIHDWSDLVRPDVKIVFANPKTSGTGRYCYLGAWIYFQQHLKDEAQVENQMQKLIQNVAVFDTGSRGATNSFVDRDLGDVLVSYEAEVKNMQQQYAQKDYEIVIPKENIRIDFPVAWIDKNIKKNHTEQAAKAYLNFLYQPQVQQIFAKHFFRVSDPSLTPKLPQVRLSDINQSLGDWASIMRTHFNSGGILDKLQAAISHK